MSFFHSSFGVSPLQCFPKGLERTQAGPLGYEEDYRCIGFFMCFSFSSSFYFDVFVLCSSPVSIADIVDASNTMGVIQYC